MSEKAPSTEEQAASDSSSCEGEGMEDFDEELAIRLYLAGSREGAGPEARASTSCTSRSRPNAPASLAAQNRTFSSEQLRHIQRTNAILMDKILAYNGRPNQYKMPPKYTLKMPSAAVNRKRNQEKITKENQMLLKKIQAVKPCVKRY